MMDIDVKPKTISGQFSNDTMNMKGSFSSNKHTFRNIEGEAKGTDNYIELINKPSINSVILVGNKEAEELDLQREMTAMTFQEIDNIMYGGDDDGGI